MRHGALLVVGGDTRYASPLNTSKTRGYDYLNAIRVIVAFGDMVGTSVQTVTAVRSRPTPEVSLAMAKTQEVLTRVAMCTSSHHGYFCTAAALPCHPCGLRMLKDSHGLAALLRAGTALAPFIRQ